MSKETMRVLMPIGQLLALTVFLGLGYLYVISGLGVPTVFLFMLWAAWGALLVLGIQHRHDVRYLFGVPVSAAVIWTAIALGLGSLLDWQA